MKRSTDRILTSHTGSLPRPEDLLPLIFAKEADEPVDDRVFDTAVEAAVLETVRRQVDAGVDVLSDGEVSKPSYATYVKDRLSGFGGESSSEAHSRRSTFSRYPEFPDFKPDIGGQEEGRTIKFVTCDGPVA